MVRCCEEVYHWIGSCLWTCHYHSTDEICEQTDWDEGSEKMYVRPAEVHIAEECRGEDPKGHKRYGDGWMESIEKGFHSGGRHRVWYWGPGMREILDILVCQIFASTQGYIDDALVSLVIWAAELHAEMRIEKVARLILVFFVLVALLSRKGPCFGPPSGLTYEHSVQASYNRVITLEKSLSRFIKVLAVFITLWVNLNFKVIYSTTSKLIYFQVVIL